MVLPDPRNKILNIIGGVIPVLSGIVATFATHYIYHLNWRLSIGIGIGVLLLFTLLILGCFIPMIVKFSLFLRKPILKKTLDAQQVGEPYFYPKVPCFIRPEAIAAMFAILVLIGGISSVYYLIRFLFSQSHEHLKQLKGTALILAVGIGAIGVITLLWCYALPILILRVKKFIRLRALRKRAIDAFITKVKKGNETIAIDRCPCCGKSHSITLKISRLRVQFFRLGPEDSLAPDCERIFEIDVILRCPNYRNYFKARLLLENMDQQPIDSIELEGKRVWPSAPGEDKDHIHIQSPWVEATVSQGQEENE